MDVKIILKNHFQQKLVKVFHQTFFCLQYCHLKTENKHNVYRNKDFMKRFCEFLREHAMKRK